MRRALAAIAAVVVLSGTAYGIDAALAHPAGTGPVQLTGAGAAAAGGIGAGSPKAIYTTAGSAPAVHRFNEAAAHSPQLDRLLAGHPAAKPLRSGRRGHRATAGAGQAITAVALRAADTPAPSPSTSTASVTPSASATPSPSGSGASTASSAAAPSASVAPSGPAAPQAAATSAAAPTLYQGIDVASFQHPDGAAINWGDVAAAGYKFAFIKATEGSYYVNPYYAADSAGAQQNGLFAAPYAFGIPNYSTGTRQADYAVDNSHWAADGKVLPLILDIEYDPYDGSDGTNECYGLTSAQMVSWIGAFTAEVHRRTGQAAVIYSTADWWKTCTGDSTAFGGDPLWIAGDASTTAPILPPTTDWSTWTYWQYTSSATIPGISGTTFDASYLSATALEMAVPANQSDSVSSSPAALTVGALSGDVSTAATYTAAGLPAGLTLSDSGVTDGTLPGTTGSFPVSVTATAGSLNATQRFTWSVHGTPSLASMPARSGAVGTPVEYQVPLSDGLSGCTLTVTATGLPQGLSINSCGLISGWLRAGGTHQVSVHVTDSSGDALTQRSFAFKVTPASGSGPAGQIKLSRDGKCLDRVSASDIAIETCTSTTAQRWTITATGSIRIGGLCLAAMAASGSNPAALHVAACTGGGQRWQVGSYGALRDLTDNRCLADTGLKNGVRATAAVCSVTSNKTGSVNTPSRNQQWALPAGPLAAGIAGYCASDWHGAKVALGPVTLRGCDGGAEQAFSYTSNGSIGARGDCLQPASGKTAVNTAVRLARCNGSSVQAWQVLGGPIGLQFFNPASGLCLADPGDRRATGAVLAIGSCVPGDPGITFRVS
ncbi:MAG TPA: GH25 family lysozyme [Streptosporangiaceae bacterium]